MVSEAKCRSIHEERPRILTPKPVLWCARAIVALALVKATNTSENLLNKTCQIIYSLYRAKQITKKVCNNIVNSIKLSSRMDTMFMNSGNSTTSDPHRLLLNLSDKINWKRSDKYVALSNLGIYYTWQNMKKSY